MLHTRALATEPLLPHVEALFRRAEERPRTRIYGRDGVIRRDALWFAKPAPDGLLPLYRTFKNAYGAPSTTAGIEQAKVPRRMPDWMEGAIDQLARTLRTPAFNHVVLHRYVDGTDYISDHRDKYMDIAPDSSIVSLSMGATRDFRVDGKTFPVADGDAVVVPYELNTRATHGVPRRARMRDVRYSITARAIDTHYDPERRVFRHRKSARAVPY